MWYNRPIKGFYQAIVCISLIAMTHDELQKRLDEVVAWLGEQYAGIRTSQATPALLDSIRVESYGAQVPIQQVGNISVEDARTLRISVWDTGMIAAVEKAIIDSGLGASVATDSAGLRVIFPELTSERREQIHKLAKAKLEEARVSVRTARDEAIKHIEGAQRSGELSEDEKFAEKGRIQKAVDAANKKLEELFRTKEAEISA